MVLRKKVYNREAQRSDVITYEDQLKVGVVGQMHSLPEDVATDDTELIALSEVYMSIAKPLHDTYYQKQKRNERYYLGDQLDDAQLDRYSARIVINKVFEILDTLMPRYTGNLPSPQILLPKNGIKAEEEIQYGDYTRKMEEVMLALAEESGLVKALKQFMMYFNLYYLGVLKFGFDADDERKMWVEAVRPQRIFIPPEGEVDWVIEYHSDTVGALVKKFKLKQKEIEEYVKSEDGKKALGNGTKLGYYEFTTPLKKWWKLGGCILQIIDNPHYDFKDKKKNHWTKPKLDYIFSDMYGLGMNGYAQTTIIDQMIVQQDALNKRKRQIAEAADRANGILVGYGTAGVTKEDIAAISAARKNPNGVVFLEKANQGAVVEMGGKTLPDIVFSDMIDTRTSIDNITGAHSTLRGEKTKGEETFGGRQLLREGDLDRIAEGVQQIERISEEVYNAYAQLVKMHFKKDEFVPYLGKDGTARLEMVNSELIKDGIKIRVRQGSTSVKGPTVLAQEAIQLWGQKGIDPITFFERIGDPNPFRSAERLYQWTVDPAQLFKEAAAQYADALDEKKEMNIVKSVMEAGWENKGLAMGSNVPPNPKATPQHLEVHAELLSNPQFLEMAANNPAIAENIKKHMMAEIAIVQANMSEKEKEMAKKEQRMNMMMQPPMAQPQAPATPPPTATGPGPVQAATAPSFLDGASMPEAMAAEQSLPPELMA